MDSFNGYKQIKMASTNAEKTDFRMPLGNFHYMVMPFGLKNAVATYQWAMTTIFHTMIHHTIEDYVDDLVVKSKVRQSLEWFSVRIQKVPKVQHEDEPVEMCLRSHGREILRTLCPLTWDKCWWNKDKVKPAPHSQRTLKRFLGKVSYLRRFIRALAEIIVPFSELLKGKTKFERSGVKAVKAVLVSLQTKVTPCGEASHSLSHVNAEINRGTVSPGG